MLAANRLLMGPSFLAALLSVAMANAALAESTTFHNPKVAAQLKELKRTATAMRDEADRLQSMTRSKRFSWQSHSDRLMTLKSHVNKIGKSLADLENQKSVASEEQVFAIEQTRMHLVPVAENLTQAIELVNERRTNVHWGEYEEAVSDIYAHADALHTKLDTILDYQDARLRFDPLEGRPALMGRE